MAKDTIWIIFTNIVLLLYGTTDIAAQGSCSSAGRSTGQPTVFRQQDGYIPGTDDQRIYIMSTQGTINCKGFLTSWTFYKPIGVCEDVTFSVWKPQVGDPSKLELRGFNVYNHVDEDCDTNYEGEITFYVPYMEQIPVYPDDVIGWIQSDNGAQNMIMWDDGSNNDVHFLLGCDTTLVSGICPINDIANDLVNRDYSLKAFLLKSEDPVIANLPATIDVYESEESSEGDVVYVVHTSHHGNHKDANVVQKTSNAIPDDDYIIEITDPTITDFILMQDLRDQQMATITISANELDFDRQNFYVIPISVTVMEQTVSSTLTINVLDVNNPHTLDKPDVGGDTIDISCLIYNEGDAIYQVKISDPDSTLAHPMVYYIEDADPSVPNAPEAPFAINSVTGVVYASRDLIDWWEQGTYSIEIAVTDGVHTAGPHRLTINLNDLRPLPEIMNLDQAISVSEDLVGGTEVFQVTVRLPRDHAVIEYELEDYNYHFILDKNTGVIYISPDHTLDIYDQQRHELDIIVRDELGREDGPNKLTITVIFVNQRPVFAPSHYTAHIAERCQEEWEHCDTLPFVVVPKVLIEDREVQQDPTATLNCKISDGFGHTYFSFENEAIINNCANGIGKIVQIADIDIDTEPQLNYFNLTMNVTDQGGLTNRGSVIIYIYDINDYSPTFNQDDDIETEIDENTLGGKPIATVTATDKDLTRNGSFTYFLSSGGSNCTESDPKRNGTFYFEIHPTTGVISTRHPADYEDPAMYPDKFEYIDFCAEAIDFGGRISTNLVYIKVWIRDVNDNHPVFECEDNRPNYVLPRDETYRCFYNLEVEGNTNPGTPQLQLQASDIDEIHPDPQFYFLVPESHFTINGLTGNITTAAKLYHDYKYVLYCLANDTGTPYLLSTPSVVRIDSYTRADYVVDIYVKHRPGETCLVWMEDFILTMRRFVQEELQYEWVIRHNGNSYCDDKDTIIVHIYALSDNSTYQYDNLQETKVFIPTRYTLLKPLRKTILGVPSDDFKDFMLTEGGFDVVLVMPGHIIWLIDTLSGLIFLLLMLLTLISLSIALGVYCCRRAGVCCFKQTNPPRVLTPRPFEPQKVDPLRQPPYTPQERPKSTDTVHTLVYDQLR